MFLNVKEENFMINSTSKDLAIILFRALCLYAFIESLNNFAYNMGQLIEYFSPELQIFLIIKLLLQPVFLLIAGIVLWIASPSIASNMLKSADDQVNERVASTDFQIVIFSAIGIYLLIVALSDVAKVLVYYHGLKSFDTIDNVALNTKNSLIASSIIQLILGAWLLFGSRGIVNFLRSFRR